jgi:hypothetical protein
MSLTEAKTQLEKRLADEDVTIQELWQLLKFPLLTQEARDLLESRIFIREQKRTALLEMLHDLSPSEIFEDESHDLGRTLGCTAGWP